MVFVSLENLKIPGKSGMLLRIVTKLILDPIFFKQTTENEVFNDKLLMYCSKQYAYHDSVYYRIS